MIQIRKGVFETNSSSTHSITICAKEDYEKWQNGEVLFDGYNFRAREEAIAELKAEKWFNEEYPDFDFNDKRMTNKVLKEYEFYTTETYEDDDDLERFEKRYKTKSGDEIVAFGKYGTYY